MSSAYRLPKTVRPSHYALNLTIPVAQDNFHGFVDVDVSVESPTKTIDIHAGSNLEVSDVKLNGTDMGTERNPDGISPSESVLRLTSATEIPAGEHRLHLAFSAPFSQKASGLYVSQTRLPGNRRVKTIATQFEAVAARTMFPCFDEPAMKARFDISVMASFPEENSDLPWQVLSNMPVSSIDEDSTINFERTPVMSTYLLALIVAPLERLKPYTTENGCQVSVWGFPGTVKKTVLAQNFATAVLDEFSSLFRLDFPLAKCDLVPVAEFDAGAMENWGLITFRPQLLLGDASTSPRALFRLYEVVAHELAHQWFGNLVTMQWWDELWLNEGFATFAAAWVTARIMGKEPDAYPFSETYVWVGFVASEMQTALSASALSSARPILPDTKMVKAADDIEQLFDDQAYAKSSVILRMLFLVLGEDAFAEGLSVYLHAHSYANATSEDLWKAFSQVSGMDVGAFMEPWIRQAGFPAVWVENDMTFTHERFLSEPTEDLDSCQWPCPIRVLMPDDEIGWSIQTKGKFPCNDLYINQWFTLPAVVLSKSIPAIAGTFERPDEASIGTTILAKMMSIQFGVESGAIPLTPDLLRFLFGGLQIDDAHIVDCAFSILSSWCELCATTSKDIKATTCAIAEGFNADICTVIKKMSVFATDSSEEMENIEDDARDLELLSVLVHSESAVSAELLSAPVAAFIDDPTSVHPYLLLDVMRTIVKDSSVHPEHIEHLQKFFMTTQDPEMSLRALACLGGIPDPDLLRKTLAWALENVPATDLVYMFSQPSPSRKARDAWLRENWDAVLAAQGKHGAGHFVVWAGALSTTQEEYDAWKAFFDARDTTGYDMSVVKMLGKLSGRIRTAKILGPQLCGCVGHHN